MTKRGKLLLIEGTDSSGKETQTNLLLERLVREGIPCISMNFPRYNTPTGRIVGQCYLGKRNLGEGDVAWFGDADNVNPRVASLYYAADRLAAAPELLRTVENGTNVILDRYYQSNMAHQGGKIESDSERGAFFEFERILELELLKIPKEDLAILLHMPTEVAVELRKRRGIEADLHEGNLGHLIRAERAYLQMAQHYWYSWKVISCSPDGTINSLRTPENIAEEVYSHVTNVLSSS